MTAVSTAGTAPRPRSRLRARLVLAGLSACGLAALAWASFVHPMPRLIYNPSDSVAVGWYRVDPRGNRPGVDAQFTPPKERLTFAIEQPGEADFPAVYPDPLPLVITALQTAPTTDALSCNLPDLAADSHEAARTAPSL